MNLIYGHLKPRQSHRFFEFLARHRNRVYVWVLGGSHLFVIVGWDSEGKKDA